MAENNPSRRPDACNTPPFVQSVEDVRREIGSLKELMIHKVDALEKLMSANDARYAQRFADANIAVNAAMISQEKAINAALTASNTAVNKAEESQNARMASMNEFRQSLSDQGATMVTRTESDAKMSALNEKIARVEKTISEWAGGFAKAGEGKSRDMWVVGTVVALAVGLLGAGAAIVASLLLKK